MKLPQTTANKQRQKERGDEMTIQPIPPSPDVGTIRYFDSIKPPLTQGKFLVETKQTFPTSVKGVNTNLPEEITKNEYIQIEGSPYQIDPLTIHSRTPPKNEQGVKVDLSIPKIVFQSKTLPWERKVNDEEHYDNCPWMSLLLIRDDEFENCCEILEGQKQYTIPGKGNSNIPFEIRVLSIKEGLLKNIGPTAHDLPYLAHALQVNPKDKELCGNDEDGIFSVIISNRLPSEINTKYHACLVSIEGHASSLPIEDAVQILTQDIEENPQMIEKQGQKIDLKVGLDHGVHRITSHPIQFPLHIPETFQSIQNLKSTDDVKLILLDYWTFNTGDGGDFESKIKAIKFRQSLADKDKVGDLDSLAGFSLEDGEQRTYEPALLGSDMDPDVTVNSFLYTDIVEHDGITRPCLYRGPCIAVPTYHDIKEEPYTNSDDARGLEPSTGLDVIHHSSAFELGRLLALSDPKFIETLSRWRRLRLKKKSLQLYRKNFLDKSHLSKKYDIESVDKLPLQSILQKAIVKETALPLKEVPPDLRFHNEVPLPPDGTTDDFLDKLSLERLQFDENTMLQENLRVQEAYTRGGQL